MFSIYKKKKKKPTEDLLPIDGYVSNSGIRPLPYTLPECLQKLEQDTPRQIKEFLQKASPDQYNQTFYDGIIFACLQEALEDLKIQKAEREQAVIALLSDKFASNLILCRFKLESCRQERAQVAQELVELQEQYCHYNTPKKGGYYCENII